MKVKALSARGYPIGEDHPRCRWSEKQLDALRAAVASGQSIRAAAAALGMSADTARDVMRGRRRAELPAAWAVYRGRRRVVVR